MLPLLVLIVFIIYSSNAQNTWDETLDSYGFIEEWRSTSDFVPVQSQSFGQISLGQRMSAEFDFVWGGRSNDPSTNKYENFFRVGFDASGGNNCDGASARYPSFWLASSLNTMHVSVSDGDTCQPSHSLIAYGEIQIGPTYHIKIDFDETYLTVDVTGGGNADWRKVWNRTATQDQYIGVTVPVWWMSNKYSGTPYNRGNGTFSNITIISNVFGPTIDPTSDPTINPTYHPTLDPTYTPTVYPTYMPSSDPTNIPSSDPTYDPTLDPTYTPSSDPTNVPSSDPTYVPSSDPSYVPSSDPTYTPTLNPINIVTFDPTNNPSSYPTYLPTVYPTSNPVIDPTSDPTLETSANPTGDPTNDPTMHPSAPSKNPTDIPSFNPTLGPSIKPTTSKPTSNPSISPTTSRPTTDNPSTTPTTSTSTSYPTLSRTQTPISNPITTYTATTPTPTTSVPTIPMPTTSKTSVTPSAATSRYIPPIESFSPSTEKPANNPSLSTNNTLIIQIDDNSDSLNDSYLHQTLNIVLISVLIICCIIFILYIMNNRKKRKNGVNKNNDDDNNKPQINGLSLKHQMKINSNSIIQRGVKQINMVNINENNQNNHNKKDGALPIHHIPTQNNNIYGDMFGSVPNNKSVKVQKMNTNVSVYKMEGINNVNNYAMPQQTTKGKGEGGKGDNNNDIVMSMDSNNYAMPQQTTKGGGDNNVISTFIDDHINGDDV